MIRYFFDVLIDGELAAEEGILLTGIEEARREASNSLADLARDELGSDRSITRLAISVRKIDGQVCEAEFHWVLKSLE